MNAVVQTLSGGPDVKGRHRRRVIRLPQSASLRLGCAVIGFFAIIAVVSVFWTPYAPMQPATGTFNAAPSWSHLFGTDSDGADIFSRALAATHTDVGITLAVVALALVVGTIWGSLVGFFGGWLDGLTMRVLQSMNSFPALPRALLAL